jgi:ankyrin repeat protein
VSKYICIAIIKLNKSVENSFRFLMSLDLNFEAVDKNNNNALHIATINGNTKMVFKIMFKFSDFNRKNDKGESPLSIAKKYEFTNIEAVYVTIV